MVRITRHRCRFVFAAVATLMLVACGGVPKFIDTAVCEQPTFCELFDFELEEDSEKDGRQPLAEAAQWQVMLADLCFSWPREISTCDVTMARLRFAGCRAPPAVTIV